MTSIEARPLPGGRGSEYRLTAAGRDLEPVLIAMQGDRATIAWEVEGDETVPVFHPHSGCVLVDELDRTAFAAK